MKKSILIVGLLTSLFQLSAQAQVKGSDAVEEVDFTARTTPNILSPELDAQRQDPEIQSEETKKLFVSYYNSNKNLDEFYTGCVESIRYDQNGNIKGYDNADFYRAVQSVDGQTSAKQLSEKQRLNLCKYLSYRSNEKFNAQLIKTRNENTLRCIELKKDMPALQGRAQQLQYQYKTSAYSRGLQKIPFGSSLQVLSDTFVSNNLSKAQNEYQEKCLKKQDYVGNDPRVSNPQINTPPKDVNIAGPIATIDQNRGQQQRPSSAQADKAI